MAKVDPEQLPLLVAQQLARCCGQRPGFHLRAAFSGGLDSTVLLHILAGLAATHGFRLSAGHVHHGLQRHADAWAEHCGRVCAALEVPLTLARVKVEPDGKGLEAAARGARYMALSGMEHDWLVLAHHRGDQAETVLHRLLRGAGVAGAAAMRPVDAERHLLRPLLQVPRTALLEYARRRHLVWIEDASNADTHFTRNFLRHDILRPLGERFPGAEAALVRAAGHFAEAADLLDELARQDRESVRFGEAGSRSRFASLSPARAANLLRHVLSGRVEQPPPAGRMQEILHQLRTSNEAIRQVVGNTAFCAWGDRVWDEPAVLPCGLRMPWKGEEQLLWGEGRIVFSPAAGPGALRLPEGEVWLTARETGDRLRPASNRPSRDFKTLCQSAGIAPWWRAHLPVLRCAGRPLWIGGVGADVDSVCAPGEKGWQVAWQRDGTVLSAGPRASAAGLDREARRFE